MAARRRVHHFDWRWLASSKSLPMFAIAVTPQSRSECRDPQNDSRNDNVLMPNALKARARGVAERLPFRSRFLYALKVVAVRYVHVNERRIEHDARISKELRTVRNG